MATWTPDPTFYPSPRMAVKAPPETLAYVVDFDPERKRPDRVTVVDVDSRSKSYAQIVGRVDMPGPGDELHHFGWNACASCHGTRARRYLIIPGLVSGRIHVVDTADPRAPRMHKVIEPKEVVAKTKLTAPT